MKEKVIMEESGPLSLEKSLLFCRYTLYTFFLFSESNLSLQYICSFICLNEYDNVVEENDDDERNEMTCRRHDREYINDKVYNRLYMSLS